MKDLLKIFLSRLATENHGFYAQEKEYKKWEFLEKAGYLVPASPATSAFCSNGNPANILWIKNEVRKGIPCLCCRDCGITEIEPQLTRRWTLYPPHLLDQITKTLRINGPIVEIFSMKLWLLGRFQAKNCYFLAGFDINSVRNICNELRNFPKAIIATGLKMTMEEIHSFLPNICFPLEEIAIINEKGKLVIDDSALASYLPEEELSKTRSVFTQKSSSRESKIQSLMLALKEHIELARDYAKITKKAGNMIILPRPTQEELAAKTNMTKYDVSRCLHDPRGENLLKLWKLAGNLGDSFDF